jgi:hypothetical protein
VRRRTPPAVARVGILFRAGVPTGQESHSSRAASTRLQQSRTRAGLGHTTQWGALRGEAPLLVERRVAHPGVLSGEQAPRQRVVAVEADPDPTQRREEVLRAGAPGSHRGVCAGACTGACTGACRRTFSQSRVIPLYMPW